MDVDTKLGRGNEKTVPLTEDERNYILWRLPQYSKEYSPDDVTTRIRRKLGGGTGIDPRTFGRETDDHKANIAGARKALTERERARAGRVREAIRTLISHAPATLLPVGWAEVLVADAGANEATNEPEARTQ